MNIVVAIKIVADDQDIMVAPDGSLDYSKAHKVVSAYDLSAIEVAAQIASSIEDSKVTAIAVADDKADDSKLKKNILARGVDELVLVADSAAADLDAHATAIALSRLINSLDDVELVVCGDGSADSYAQQVDVQLASLLDWPVVTAALKVDADPGSIICDRLLETQLEKVQVALPAVVSVVPDAALPRIPGMKDILAAGKKPATVDAISDVITPSIDVIETKAPPHVDRAGEVYEMSTDGDFDKFVAALKAAL